MRREITPILLETLDALKTSVENGSTALVIYSLSEVRGRLPLSPYSYEPIRRQVVEAAGEEAALSWLDALSAVTQSATSKGDTASRKPLVLCVVHSACHTRAALNRLEVLAALSINQCLQH